MTSDEISRFCVEDVNQRLPLVRLIVRDIVQLHQDIQSRRERLRKLTSRSDDTLYSDEVEVMEQQVRVDSSRLDAFIEELRGIGGVLQNPATGHIDFPAVLDGEPVSLCWTPEDGDVAWWHAEGDDFSSRRSLLETVSEEDNS